jgi:hypothetical protein
MTRVLFIPDRFTDYRMWSDVPDSLLPKLDSLAVSCCSIPR